MIKGKRVWQTRGDFKQLLGENQSSRFGTTPLECYVCFRSSQLAQTAGAKQVKLTSGLSGGIILMDIMDAAESKSVEFTLLLGDGKTTFTHMTRPMSDDIRRRNIRR